jgi:hypothetical protein
MVLADRADFCLDAGAQYRQLVFLRRLCHQKRLGRSGHSWTSGRYSVGMSDSQVCAGICVGQKNTAVGNIELRSGIAARPAVGKDICIRADIGKFREIKSMSDTEDWANIYKEFSPDCRLSAAFPECQRHSIHQPRVARNELPWVMRQKHFQPNGVASSARQTDATLSGLGDYLIRVPRVVALLQPWAG